MIIVLIQSATALLVAFIAANAAIQVARENRQEKAEAQVALSSNNPNARLNDTADSTTVIRLRRKNLSRPVIGLWLLVLGQSNLALVGFSMAGSPLDSAVASLVGQGSVMLLVGFWLLLKD